MPDRYLNIDGCVDEKRQLKEQKNKLIYLMRKTQNPDISGELGGTKHDFKDDFIPAINQQHSSTVQIARIEEESHEVSDSQDIRASAPFNQVVKELLCNIPYISSVSCISVLFFVISGI